jgi:MFS family permease
MVRVSAGPSAGGSQDAAVLRRLVILVGAAVLIDTAFFAVVAPLLPMLSHQLHLSKAGAGLLTACYPAGMLVASIPGGMLAMRFGPRLTVCAGLALLGCSTIAFGVLNTAAGLDLARFVEGVAGACSWAGGLAWLVAAAPSDRRGVTIGQAVGAAVAGSMAGPAIGALASATGRATLFSGLAVVAFVMAVVTFTIPDERPAAGDQSLRTIVPLLRRHTGQAALWLMALPAIASGLLTVLGSLQLHHFGASAALIGVTFLVAAALETVVSPLVGTLSDRHGRMAPMRIGLAVEAVLLACFTLPRAVLPLAVVMVLMAAGLGAFWAPSMALLSDAADNHQVDQGLAAALSNLAWALGQIIGSGAGGAIAKAGGDLLPTAVGAGLFGATLMGALFLGRPERFSSGPQGPRQTRL